jgi:hypothetical protein
LEKKSVALSNTDGDERSFVRFGHFLPLAGFKSAVIKNSKSDPLLVSLEVAAAKMYARVNSG